MADEQVDAGGVQTPSGQDAEGKGTAAAPQPVTQAANSTPAHEPAQQQTDFQKWQSERDKERARLMSEADRARREAQQARQAAEQAQFEAQQARLAGADPEEREKFYRDQVGVMQQRQRQQEEDQRRQQAFSQKAMNALQKAGIDPTDTRLAAYITGDSWDERLANLAEGIAVIQNEELQKLRAEVARAEKRGAQQALNAAGVTQTSDAAPGAQPTAVEAREKDLRERWRKIKGTGNERAYMRLRAEADELGISLR